MTVRMLKEMLKDVPDDARIYADDGYRMFEGNSEFVELCHCIQFPHMIVLQTKHDFDYVDELEAKLEHYSEENWNEMDMVKNLSEHGYNAEDFEYDNDRFEWASKAVL